MFKKLIIGAISASFVVSAAFADSTNVGFRVSAANLAASGTSTQDSSSVNSGGAQLTHTSRDGSFKLPSLFVERQIDTNASGLSIIVGLDFVPLTESVATLGGGNGTDAEVNAGNLVTTYIQPTFAINDTLSVFAKAGYAVGDLEIDNITRQATTDGAPDAASTDTSADHTLAGPVYGVGVQLNRSIGLLDFVRLEVTRTDFDQITHVNSNSKVLTADAEMKLITLTIGKSF
mgnify:CR=1 FL=1